MRLIIDLKEYSQGSFLRMLSTLILNPNFHCVALYRLAHIFGKNKVTAIFSKMLMYINRVIYSVDIDYRADLAGGFLLIHGIGTVIGKGVKTEGRIKVYQGVTLGGNNNKKREIDGRIFSQPWLKKNSIIYSNSTLIGPIVVGENASIGANTIITKDVEKDKLIINKVETQII